MTEKMTLMDLWDRMSDIGDPDVDLQAKFLDAFGIEKEFVYTDSLLKTLIYEEMSKRKSKRSEDPFKNVTMTLVKYIEFDAFIEHDGDIDDPAFWDLLMLIETDCSQEEFNSKVNDYFEKILSDYVSSSIFSQAEKDIIVRRLKFLYKLYELLDEDARDAISFAVKYGYYDDNYRPLSLIKSIVEALYIVEAAHHDSSSNIYKDKSFDYIKSRLFLIFKTDKIRSDKEKACNRSKMFAVVEKSQYDDSFNSIIGYTSDPNLDTKLNEYAKEVEEVDKTYILTKLK